MKWTMTVLAFLFLLPALSAQAVTSTAGDRLLAAAKNGDSAAASELLSQGTDPNSKDEDGCTPLMAASQFGKAEVVNLLLSKSADVNVSCGYDQNTALMYAAQNGYPQIVSVLLAKGAILDAKNKDGWTPLLFAANSDFEEVVRMLLEDGANVNQKDTGDNTALMLVCDKDNPDIATVNDLLDHGADVNAKENIVGVTALMNATMHGNAGVVRALIAKGANVNAKTDNGKTVLMFATEDQSLAIAMGLDPHTQGHAECAQILRTAGAQ